METTKAVQERRSIRKFLSKEIPSDLLHDLMDQVRWAPSWGNTQVWELYVITGGALSAYKQANLAKCVKGDPPSPDISMPEQWTGQWNNRYTGLFRSLMDGLAIDRNDKEARGKLYAEMFKFFDAPCLVIIGVDKSLCLPYAMLDTGLILQTLCLLAHDRGLGTCIEACAVMYPQLLRERALLPENKLAVIGAALGYPDMKAPINGFPRERADLDEVVQWLE
ncbi:MAG TPA: nitroreductase [Thermodesulfobacteriota bacterium]|nr:nitroreductase [Deltaproteobacteria bacterium]HNR12586.1 nitroreductase [Thermodesulfobacteriota bacterium]HNU71386.1 nitroreductase [Thermodesulfobacteriota bacterium]HQO79110.1 nitroreductase [Thermodesulfobacteriota bacterium]